MGIISGTKHAKVLDPTDYCQVPSQSGSTAQNTQMRQLCIFVRALVSYPGSGNTWLRDLVEAGTGLTTGDERDWAHM